MFPEDRGHARVRHDIRVALQFGRLGEAPVLLRGACVVIVNERHRLQRPGSHETRWAALRVRQIVVFFLSNRLLHPRPIGGLLWTQLFPGYMYISQTTEYFPEGPRGISALCQRLFPLCAIFNIASQSENIA